MSALILLIGISLAMSGAFVWMCLASIRSGQFDDLDSPRWRVFFSGASESIPPAPGPQTETPQRIDP